VLTIIRHGLVGLVIWLLVIGIVLGIGFRLRSLEKRVRSLPCGSKVLEQEYRRTTENWAKN
jgi:predicted membrane protein